MEAAVSMELEAEDGATRIPIAPGPEKTKVGRGTGLASSDRIVSRCHVSFQCAGPSQDNPEGEALQDAEVPRVAFEVIGKNPVLVLTRAGGKEIFRRSENGELGAGDRISLSLKNPFFLSLKRSGGGGVVDKGVLDAVQRREKRTVQRRKEREEAKERETEGSDVASVKGEEEGGSPGLESKFQIPDLSQIDFVKEFGFLVRGHEFDHYARKIRDIKNWNWFLHEQKDSSEEDEYPEERTMAQKGRRKAKRKAEDNGDEDWTGDSEDGKVVAAEASSARRNKYLTRSKDHKMQKPTSPSEETVQGKGYGGRKRSFEEEETLGGFIVENAEEGEEEEEEEEEEFEEGEEDDD